ncbi:hypothetical protein ACFX4N_24100 [Priestia sp. YIM B13551]|uniref:hypothetical protein n=1 Tax=Priestia sp. YIM B13551 TaxID=3366306 RepID=UPI00366F581F
MSIQYPSLYVKNKFQYQCYKKCHEKINLLSEEPSRVLGEEYALCYRDDFFGDLIPGAVGTMCDALYVDYAKEDFEKVIGEVIHDVVNEYTMDVLAVFHFGLLHDYLYLFDKEEQQNWMIRMSSLMDELPDNTMTFGELFSDYTTSTGKKPEHSLYLKEMEFTYVITFDYEFMTPYEYGPDYFFAFEKFALNYFDLYKELINEIKNRRLKSVC